jgi:predicted DNA-binding WGR domain protein
VNVRYGRAGANGASDLKTFDTAAEAQKFVDKMVREKTNKGYV